VAIDSSLELQVTFLLVAFSGKTVAVSLADPPSTNSNLVSFNVTPVTGIFLPQLDIAIGVTTPVGNTPIVKNNNDLINFNFIFFG